jgi:hypothetical protein
VPSDQGATVVVAPDRRTVTVTPLDLGSTRRSRDRRPPPLPRALVEPPSPCAPRWAPDTRASWWGVKTKPWWLVALFIDTEI